MSSFDDALKEKISEAESIVYSFLPEHEAFTEGLTEAMNYSVTAGGKRLRPLLVLACYRLFGGEQEETVYPFMAAIEMIHTYSLVHDDLPAFDNDMLRRGKPTTWAKFGELQAILAGDGLLNLAFETALDGIEKMPECKMALGVKALGILARKAGIRGMIGGQCADCEGEHKVCLSKEELVFIHENKTAALIEASMMMGAVLAGASEDMISAIERAAKAIGIAFQIKDDILDVEGDEALLGKPVGSDAKNEKSTYVSVFGMEKAKADLRAYSEEAKKIISGVGDDSFMLELVDYLIGRNY